MANNNNENKNMPHVKFDWTLNIGHIGSVLVFVLGGIFAYTDLKSDVRVVATNADIKYKEYDRLFLQKDKKDEEQDQRMTRQFETLGRQIEESRRDIRNDIRDLRESQRPRLPAIR